MYCGTSDLARKAPCIVLVIMAFCAGGCRESKEEKAAREMKEALEQAFPGLAEANQREEEMTAWRDRYGIGDKEWDELVDNWAYRTGYEGFSSSEAFWEVAKSSTPEELRSQFPPRSDSEWFSADLSRLRLQRDFSQDFALFSEQGDRPWKLRILVTLETIPDEPITRLQGLLRIAAPDGTELHSEMIDHRPDLSFVDFTAYSCEWEYDDANPKHRTLRHSDGLQAKFEVRHVTFADGRVQEFGSSPVGGPTPSPAMPVTPPPTPPSPTVPATAPPPATAQPPRLDYPNLTIGNVYQVSRATPLYEQQNGTSGSQLPPNSYFRVAGQQGTWYVATVSDGVQDYTVWVDAASLNGQTVTYTPSP